MESRWLILLLITLIACQPAAVQEVAETVCNAPYFEYKEGDCCLDNDENQVCDKDEEIITPDEVIAPEPEEEVELSPIAASIKKFRDTVDSYSFKSAENIQHYVMGNLIHIELDKAKELPDKTINKTIRAFITDIFVDRDSETAVGYCDPRSEERITGEFHADRSKCIDIINIPFELSYSEYNPELPVDWLVRFADVEPTLVEDADQYIKQPSGWKAVNPVLHFEVAGATHVLRIDLKTGLPLKVESKEGVITKKTSFDFFIHNKVELDEVVYQEFQR